MKLLRFLALLGVLGWASPSAAATYYVAKTGNNANTCVQAQSTSTPKLTVAAGVGCLASGDTLLVRAGTYDETLQNPAVVFPAGTSWANKTRIAAYPGDTVWIKPTTYAGQGPYIIGIVNYAAQYIEFDGINLDGSLLPGSSGQNEVRIEGSTNLATHPNHIRFQNAEMIGTPGLNIFPGGPAHFGIYSPATDGPGANEFINLTIHGGGEGGGFAYAFYLNTSDNLIERCNIYNVSGFGIQLNNDNGGTGLRNIVRNNRIHDITRSHDYRAGGIIASDNTPSATIYNNLIYNIGGSGLTYVIGIAPYASGSQSIYNNTIYNVLGTGVEVTSSNNTIRNNIVYATTTTYTNTGSGTVQDHNLFGTNPLFVNAAGGDFHIQASSPARNAGATISVVTTDFDGNTRPLESAYDIGAYEYVPTSTSGNTYYVAKTGSNNNSCTAAQSPSTPKLTITGGLSCLSPGSTLIVRAGTYDESFNDNIPPGTSWTSKVRIAAYPNGCASTCEAVWVKPSTNTVNIFGLQGSSTYTPQYIEFDGINTDGTNISNNNWQLSAWSGGNSGFIRIQNSEHIGSPTSDKAGVILASASRADMLGGYEFINNKIHSCGATDFSQCFYIGSKNTLIERNEVYDGAGEGIQIYNGYGQSITGVIVRKNYVHDMRKTVSGQRHVGIGFYGNNIIGALAYDNIVKTIPSDIPGANYSGVGIFIDGGVSGTLVYNNSVTGAQNFGIALGNGYGGSVNTVLRNNISYNNGTNYQNLGTGTVADHNITDGTNPLWVSSTDFHLQAGSPARNTGTTVAAVPDDFYGTTRPQESAYDIGATEFLSSSQPVPVTVSITTPAASGSQYATATSPLTTFAGTASGGTLTTCTWTNTNGGSGSGTATGTSSWSVASITLTANVINHLTITCSNTSPASSSASIDVLYVPTPGSVTDNFNRANWPNLGPSWTNQLSAATAVISGNLATSTSASNTTALFSAVAAPNDQCTQVTIKSVAANSQYVGVAVRSSGADSTLNQYLAWTDGSTLHIVQINTGTVTTLLTTAATFLTNDTFKLCVVSQSLQAYKNGVAVGSAVTAGSPTLASGSAGIELQGTGAALDDFIGSSSADITPPTISITAPSSTGSYTASATPLTTLAGTASDNVGVTSVTWANSTGGSGTATGTTSWSVASITLTAGTNNITVTAHDAAGNTTSQVLSVTYVPPTPATPPTVTITSLNANYETGSPMLTTLAGTSFSSGGTITGCTWQNTVGGSGSGSTTGTTSWSVASITLTANVINRIIVTCTDNNALTGSAQIDVLYVPPPTSASDDFNRVDWPDLGPNWTSQTADAARLLSNTAKSNSTLGQYEIFSGWGLTADQCSQATISNISSASVGVLIRAAGSLASQSGYLFRTDGSSGSGHTEVLKVVNGSSSVLGAISTTFSTSNTMKLCVIGSSLQAYKNGTAVGGAITDTSLTSGSAGIYLLGVNAAVDSFLGTNTSGSTSNKLPIADTGGPYTGSVNVAMKVNASHSIAQRGVIKRYNWVWGDGSTTSTNKPITTHTYTSAGVYTLTLTVQDSRHQTSLPATTTATIS